MHGSNWAEFRSGLVRILNPFTKLKFDPKNDLKILRKLDPNKNVKTRAWSDQINFFILFFI